MSAVSQPVAPPASLPPPKPAPIRKPERPLWFRLLPVVLVLIVAGVVAWALFKPGQKTAAPVSFKTAKVFSGPMDRTLRMSGVVAARTFANVTAPLFRGPDSRNSLILLYLVKSGAVVKKGERIVSIDAQSAIDHVDDVRDIVRQAENDVYKRKAEQAVDWENLQQTLRVAKATYDKAKYDAQAAEVRTDVERELLKLAEEEAAARYKEQQQDLDYRKASQEAEIKILQFTLERHKRHVGRHEHDLALFTINSPMDGLAVMQTIWRGGDLAQIQQGDQVWPGMPIMKVVDPKSMQLEGSINQSNASELRIGQEAVVGLDAFPGVKFHGRVRSIGALAVGGWRQNYYIRNVPVRVSIEDQDERVIPDLSAHGTIQLGRITNAVQAPLAAVKDLGNDKGEVWIKAGAGFERREVATGDRNNANIEIKDGLKSGDELRID